MLELLAWFGTSQEDHFSNIVASGEGIDEIVDVNDVSFCAPLSFPRMVSLLLCHLSSPQSSKS